MLRYIEQHTSQHASLATASATPLALIEKVGAAQLSRRRFLQSAGAGAGLVVAMQLLPFSRAEAFEPYPTGGLDMPHGIVTDPHVFVSIDPDGTVTLVTHRSEMGTGARTGVPMVLADELEADWNRVKIVQAPGDEPKYGNQDTDGSRSLRHYVQPMRQIGASVRLMLERAAAERWGIEPRLAKASNHEVVRLKEEKQGEGMNIIETGERLGYGELAEAAMAQPVPAFEELNFKEDADFRYVGKGELPIYDLHDITTGKAVYGADVNLAGMLFAVVARPPVVGGKLKSVDAAETLKVSGVLQTVEIPGAGLGSKFAPLGGVAVVAHNTWQAIQGRDKLKLEWDDGEHASYDSEAYHQAMSETAKKPGKVIRAQGDADAAFSAAAKVVSAEYHQQHMAHSAMEPLVAVADVRDGKAEIWAPVQSPYGTRQDVAAALGLDVENVTVHVTLLGGGFGRKSKCDYVIEAALVSREVGAPIKLQWTREDDIQHSFYHTTSVERIEAAVDDQGKVTGWRHRSVAPSILSTFAPDSGYQFPIEYGMGFADMPFQVDNLSCENGQVMAHTRIGWFRSVSNIPRAFAVQSFAAELAHELGRDHKEVLLELIGPDRKIDPKSVGMPDDLWNYGEPYDEFPIDTARMKNVLNLAAEKAGWGRDLPEGEGLGLAVHRSFVTYVASAVRVKIGADGQIEVPEVHTAIDCGFCINPERVRSQIEGAAVMGLTLAMYSGVTFKDGRAVQSNFHDYPVARIDQFPSQVHTHIVEHPFSVHATGVGEPGLPPFAPALANAIFAATGKRERNLPFGDRVRTA